MHQSRLAALVVAIGLAACQRTTDTFNQPAQVGSTSMLLTTADLRTISERPHPLNDGRNIICTEPPPDVAKALSTALALSASGGNGSAQGAFAFNSVTAEQLAELAGRVPGLLALRDTLFRACEAYANGTLGDDAYALIVSRYGELLTTLILGDAVSPSSANLAALQGINLNPPTPQNTGAKQNTSPSKNTTSDGGAPADGAPASELNLPPNARVRVASLDPAFVQAAAAGHLPGMPPAGGTPPKTKTQTSVSKQNTNQPPAASSALAVSGPQALEEMQKNYMGLGIVGPLLIACVNEHDQTRRGQYLPASTYPPGRQNDLLSTGFCNDYITRVVTLEWVERLKAVNVSESLIKQVLGIH
jgi:hypothetical protein